MLTKNKKIKLISQLKAYYKQFLNSKRDELDESGTRLMINEFLTNVLGFISIDEVKTEYMIRGTYADYVIQTKGIRHFLVEVKSLSLNLSEKHLRQTINYGANEGIEWAMLTNGKQFDFYKILFQKPIESRLVFSLNLDDATSHKTCAEILQYLHKDAITNNGLDKLWQKTIALDPKNVAGLLYAKPVTNFIRRALNSKFKHKFTEDEIETAINHVIQDAILIDDIKQLKEYKPKKRQTKLHQSVNSTTEISDTSTTIQQS
ncbi:MAG: type I restriction enzyme HsdR N-terminal domain-containing protein [Bacteroidia bacterium]|jgi:hypothetical protein|nr:type I restriction enzyme HsdR N-terminal domain-containing protein [Bacteroidia bacterium]